MNHTTALLIMKKCWFLLLLVILLAPLASAAQVYYVSFTGTDAGISYSTLWIGNGNPPQPLDDGVYSAEIVDISGKARYKTTFQPSLGTFLLTLPYFGNGQAIVIKDKAGRVLFDLPTSQFLNTCGDAVCQNYEQSISCPADCISPPLAEVDKEEQETCLLDGDCDASCVDDPDCPEEVLAGDDGVSESGDGRDAVPIIFSFFQRNVMSLILAAFIILLIFVFVVVRTIHKKIRRKEIVVYIQENLQRGYSWEQISAALRVRGTSDKEIERTKDAFEKKAG